MPLPSNEAIATDIRRLLAEEAHLIGQEVQGALGREELHRRHALSVVLDELTEQFEHRRARRV